MLWDGREIRSTVRRIARISRKRVVTKRSRAGEYPNADIRSVRILSRTRGRRDVASNALARAIETGAAVITMPRERRRRRSRPTHARSGLIYQTRPQNPYAAQLQDEMEKRWKSCAEAGGRHRHAGATR